VRTSRDQSTGDGPETEGRCRSSSTPAPPSVRAFGKDRRMAAVIGAHHTSFTVADLNRSVAFFRDVLGLELLFVREIFADHFDRLVGLPKCEVHAALLRIPNSDHHVELFQYLEPLGTPHSSKPCDPGSCHLCL